MMASVIDLAVRRTVAAGGKPGTIAGLDNFCWPDPVKSAKTPDGDYKMAQLVRANEALYDYTKAFTVPCISGKDSMKNDSTRGGKKISIPPSVLFSTIAKIDDVSKAVSLDFKKVGDDVYVIGLTKDELGGGEFFAMLGATGNKVPKVDAKSALKTYKAVNKIVEGSLASSIGTPAIGGLAIALAKAAMGGRLGVEIDLAKVPVEGQLTAQEILFSESNSRFVMTSAPGNAAKIEKALKGIPFAKVGKVTAEKALKLGSSSVDVEELVSNYKSTLAGV